MVESSVAPQEGETARKVKERLEGLTETERQLLARVIQAERDRLHMKTPRGISDDIWRAVTETIR